MTTVQQIYDCLNAKAPFSLQESWDNSGLNVGDPVREVKRILVALDITDAVIEEAVKENADLIVSHHPLIFSALKHVTLNPDDLTGRKVWNLAKAGISAICCHTNLDAVEGGVNTALAQSLELKNITQLSQCGTDEEGRPYGFGRIGTLEKEMNLTDFLPRVQNALMPHGLRYVDGGKMVHRVAVGGGACGGFMLDAWKAGCDTFVTSDLKYNQFLDAKELGLNLIDAGHFPTENIILPTLTGWLTEAFPQLTVIVSAVHGEVFDYHTSGN